MALAKHCGLAAPVCDHIKIAWMTDHLSVGECESAERCESGLPI
jgi:hypothetical protein